MLIETFIRKQLKLKAHTVTKVEETEKWMIMNSSVSSTFVTVCAFNPSCFLMNVSMSTSIPFLSWLCATTLKRLDGSGFHTANPLDQKAFTSIALFGYEPFFFAFRCLFRH